MLKMFVWFIGLALAFNCINYLFWQFVIQVANIIL